MKIHMAIIGFVLCFFCFGNVMAEEFVAKVDAVDYKGQRLVVGDTVITYTNLVTVTRNEKKERVSVRSIKVGDWVSIDLEIDHSIGLRQANAIEILENYSPDESY